MAGLSWSPFECIHIDTSSNTQLPSTEAGKLQMRQRNHISVYRLQRGVDEDGDSLLVEAMPFSYEQIFFAKIYVSFQESALLKRFNIDHAERPRLKPGSRIVGSEMSK